MKLSFRETGIKREVKNRIILLVIVFFAALVLFFFVLNFHVAESESSMGSPTLPTLSLEAYGRELAPLHGYVRDMDASYMHDAIVPIEKDRMLPFYVDTYNNKIDEVTLELRSLDTSRKIAESTVSDFKKTEGRLYASPQLANLMEEGQEYIVVFHVKTGGRTINYYTRVTIPGESHTRECIDFTLSFSKKAIAGKQGELASYMETDKDSNHDTLSMVDIHSTVDQVCWKGFDGKRADEPVLEIKDISPGFCVSTLNYYMIMDKNYYYVEEYFRVRYGEQRMFLLDYERRMDRILTTTNARFENGKLLLGSVSEDPPMMSNETGTICAFSNLGTLFEFNENRHLMTKVFSFGKEGNITDVREGYQAHGIRILNIDESGTMDFVVYGYMNSGIHEGECGIDIYHYNSSSNVAKEIAFISTTSPYQILSEGISDLLYRSNSGNIYIMVEGTLFRIDAVANHTSEVMGSLGNAQYAVSKSGRYIAWTDEDKPSETIHVMDLSDESVSDIESQSGELIRPIAFMTDDLVYGCIRPKDVTTETREQKIYPMYRLFIVSVSGEFGEVIKEYKKSGIYITDTVLDSYALYLTREKKVRGKYVSTTSDTIMASDGEQNLKVSVVREKSEKIGEMAMLAMSVSTSDEDSYSAAGKNASLALRTSGDTVEINAVSTQTKYYVYVASRIVYSGMDIKSAINVADKKSGVVVDNHQHYVWRNGKALYKFASDNKSAASFDPGNGDELLDLTGVTLDQVLYYVYLGEPAYGQLEGEMVTIVGYNSLSVNIYHPSTGKTETIDSKEANKQFEKEGNIFFVLHDLS